MEAYLRKLSEAYYAGNPLVTNEEYDALSSTYWHILAGAGDIPHRYRMHSLKKHYEGEFPIDVSACVKTPKLDGAAVSLQYTEDTGLALALTRGDGFKGKDITEKMRRLTPRNVTHNIQVEGEVVAVKEVSNSRNFASGALNVKSMEHFFSKTIEGGMEFIAYGVKGSNKATYLEDLEFLRGLGFQVVTDKYLSDKFPTDGTVYRLNDNTAFADAGYTDKYPRGAFAHKDADEFVTTELLDVIWQTGASGKVTPVAILAPVAIGDAVISRATLNNIAYIEALGLDIGCSVKVVRAGSIIPKIVGKVEKSG